MGGTIRIIKKENNLFKSYTGWTNSISLFTDTNKFYKDKDWASNRIEKWGVIDSKPNFNSSEYGIIFIDFDNKRIYECQEYSTIGKFHKSSIRLALMPDCRGYEHILQGSKEFINDGALLYKADAFQIVNKEGLFNYELTKSITETITYDELIDLSKEEVKKITIENGFIDDDFYIDFSKYGWVANSWIDEPIQFFSKLFGDDYHIMNMIDFKTWKGGSKIISELRDFKLNKLI
jgi:hypothetical protein